MLLKYGIAISLLICALYANAFAKATVRATVYFVDCGSRPTQTALTVRVIDLVKRRVALDKRVPANTTRVKTATFDLAPSAYELQTGTATCSQHGVFTILDGSKETNITLIGKPVINFSGVRSSIAGLLPLEGAIVAVVYKDLRAEVNEPFRSPDGFYQVPCVVDGSHYYAGELPLGMATIRIYDATRTRWLDLPPVELTSKNRNVIRNVSVADLNGDARGL